MGIRAFIAVDPSDEVIRRLSETIRQLEKRTRGFRWVRPEAIHLTLRFLGEIEEETVSEIETRLGRLAPSFTPIALKAGGLGFFPGPERPRVVWAGLSGDIDRLEDLQKGVEDRVIDLPVHREKERGFTPHLTLARIPNFRAASGIAEILRAAPGADFGDFVVDRLFLYKSHLHPDGARYTKLGEYLLGGT